MGCGGYDEYYQRYDQNEICGLKGFLLDFYRILIKIIGFVMKSMISFDLF